MFRSWRKTSIESQESMEPGLKRQKTSEKDECELTGVPIHKHTSIEFGHTKVWAPGLLLFNKYFTHLSSSLHLTPEILKEAKEKCLEKDSPDFYQFVMSELTNEYLLSEEQAVKQESHMADLNIQKFWLLYLSVLEKRLLSHLKLDHPGTTLYTQILKLYYHLTLMLHSNIPEEAVACLNRLCKTLDTTLMGADFWEYNPILLTRTHIWAHQFVDDLLQDHSKRGKTPYIAFTFYLSSAHHPFPGLPEISEEQVCDQQLALRLARGEISEYESEEWNSTGNWMVFAGVGNTFQTTLGSYAINAITY